MIIDYISGMIASKKEALENPGNNEYGCQTSTVISKCFDRFKK